MTGEGVEELKAIIEEVREDWFNEYGGIIEQPQDVPEEADNADEDDEDEPFTGFLTPNRNK